MKKIISIVLTLSIMFSLCGTCISHASDFISDIEKDEFVNQIRFLETIGVLNPEHRKNLEDTITRAELAEILASMDTRGIYSFEQSSAFADVANEEQQTYISKVVGMGIMSATEDGYFFPERTVMTNEVICALVRMVGYQWEADEKGGFPSGYIYVAREKNMFRNINLNMEYPITYRSLIGMIMNTAKVDFFGKKLSTTESVYEVIAGKNIMSDWWELEEKYGVVTANKFTSLTHTTAAPEGFIGIEGAMYPVLGDFNDLLGYYIKYYYHTREETIVYVDSLSDHNQTIRLDSDDIVDFEERVFRYTEKNKVKNLKLESSIDVIYNGSALTQYNKNDLMPSEGSITFIDNDKNGGYDVVLVEGYQTIVVYSVDAQNQIIYDKFDNTRNVDCSDCEEENVYIYDADDNRMSFEELRMGDVLSVLKSQNNLTTKIYVSRTHIEGKAESYNIEDRIIRINNTDYKVIAGYFDFQEHFSLEYGSYYLNRDNKIVAYTNLTGDQYGYLISGGEREGDEWLELKIFDHTGRMLKLKCAEKVKVDGIQKKKIVDIVDALKKGEAEILPQLIQYRLNKSGEIKYIDTPYNNQPGNRKLDDLNAPYRTVSPEVPEKEDSLRMTYASNGIEYRYDQRTLGGKIFLSDNTFFFSVPSDISTAKDDDFDVTNLSFLRSGEYYRFDSYASGEDPLTADVIVLVGMGNGRSRTGIISAIKNEVRNDEVGYSIELLSKHGKDRIWVDDVSLVEQMPAQDTNDTKTYCASIGDIVQVSMNAQMTVRTMTLLVDASEENADDAVKMAANPTSTSFTATNKLIYGSVYSKYNGIMSVTTDRLPTDNKKVNLSYQEAYNVAQFAIYKVDKGSRTTIERVSVNDVMDYVHCGQGYSKVAVLSDNAVPLLVVIYE